MTDYLVQVKVSVDSIVSFFAGTRIEEEALIDYVIDGLGSEFGNSLHNLHFQRESITYDDSFWDTCTRRLSHEETQ